MFWFYLPVLDVVAETILFYGVFFLEYMAE